MRSLLMVSLVGILFMMISMLSMAAMGTMAEPQQRDGLDASAAGFSGSSASRSSERLAEDSALDSSSYVFEVSRCPADLDWNQWNQPNISVLTNFILDAGYGRPLQATEVRLCYDETSIHVRFDCEDDNPISPYDTCNQDLFLATVVEMFITAAQPSSSQQVDEKEASESVSPPVFNLHNYLELEISPKGVLFASAVVNPNLTCSGIQDALIPCSETGIVYSASITASNSSWWAELQVPWSLIAQVSTPSSQSESESESESEVAATAAAAAAAAVAAASTPAPAYQLNFFRIDTPLGASKEYSCWSPTFSSPACFHKPLYFGTMYLV